MKKLIHKNVGIFDLADDPNGQSIPIIHFEDGTVMVYSGPIRTLGEVCIVEVHVNDPPVLQPAICRTLLLPTITGQTGQNSTNTER